MAEENREQNQEKEKNENQEKFEELDLEFLSDISLNITVEVGKTTKLFYDILKLKEGDIITLDRHIEDYIDIYLNSKPFAIGEMVVVNNKYSVRIIDLAE